MEIEITIYHRSRTTFGAKQELIWFKGVLSEIEFNYVDPITLYMDSKSAMSLAKNPTHHKEANIDISNIIG